MPNEAYVSKSIFLFFPFYFFSALKNQQSFSSVFSENDWGLTKWGEELSLCSTVRKSVNKVPKLHDKKGAIHIV